MTTDEQGPSGSVPHAFRNALFWRWAPQMPKGLPTLFVTVLYALAAAADPAGRVRFRDGKAIRIKDIAAGCKADEKDVRRQLDAAIAAGVVGVEGERRRGRPALYILLLHPQPDWDAAVRCLEATKRKRPERQAPPWRAEKNGGPPPEPATPENGGPPPELPRDPENEERGTAPRMSSGDRPPFGSGDRPPNNPGIAKELPQAMADADEQPQDARGRTTPNPHEPPTSTPTAPPPADLPRCPRCQQPIIRPGKTTCAGCERTHTTPATTPKAADP